MKDRGSNLKELSMKSLPSVIPNDRIVLFQTPQGRTSLGHSQRSQSAGKRTQHVMSLATWSLRQWHLPSSSTHRFSPNSRPPVPRHHSSTLSKAEKHRAEVKFVMKAFSFVVSQPLLPFSSSTISSAVILPKLFLTPPILPVMNSSLVQLMEPTMH